mmetsp:Transcript_12340/g.17722  ORF Transcript_12340/g.17722 Transcript_12340/m.17722 type:complete len:110 (-) Transcript_12340:321-650(-)
MSLMTTCGTVTRAGEDQRRNFHDSNAVKHQKTLRYPGVILNHFTYRDAVDTHNSYRMFLVALEKTWKTHRWPNRVFQFLLAVTEVNVKLVLERIFGGQSLLSGKTLFLH